MGMKKWLFIVTVVAMSWTVISCKKKKEPVKGSVKEPVEEVKDVQFMKPVDFEQTDILGKFSAGKNDGIYSA